MSGAEKKSGRRREREREMDARTRPLGSRASTSLSLLLPPSPPVPPPSPPVSPSIRALWYPLFALVLAIFLAYDRRVFSHVTRLFGSFFLITCSLRPTPIANDSSSGGCFQTALQLLISVHIGMFKLTPRNVDWKIFKRESRSIRHNLSLLI